MSNEPRGAGVAEPPAGENRKAGVRAREPERNGGGDGKTSAETVERTQQGPPRSIWREYFESLVVTAIMALFGMTFIVQAVKVPTGSMQNTILIGDHLLVNKFIFAPGPPAFFLPQREIRHGDIIVFKYPGKYNSEQFQKHYEVDDTAPNNIPYSTNYVKRVIGLPGEHIEVRGTDIYVNGQLLKEQKVAAINPPNDDDPRTNGDEKGAPLKNEKGVPLVGENAPKLSGDSRYLVYWHPKSLKGVPRLSEEETEFDIPQGHYLVLGDNRENSQDSRYWGFVPREAIFGRAMFVYWSFDESLPGSEQVFPINFIVDFINNTRWSRTGTLVK
ncbi:MAG: signal peptidase I [Acidobacteria bacterium]|nr:signal peptidase I [Acidobacteriota bacterium]